MKTAIITGGRRHPNLVQIHQVLTKFNPDRVVHGGAAGVDTFAQQWCLANSVTEVVVKPDYENNSGKKAPLLRNIEMLERFPEATVLAFPDSKSRGTWHTINQARKRRMTVIVHNPESP